MDIVVALRLRDTRRRIEAAVWAARAAVIARQLAEARRRA